MTRTRTPARTPARQRPSTSQDTGTGGERHDQAGGDHPMLTSNQGVALSDNQNSLRVGERGPTLLEDFLLREKITHFDHERIPERIVHARGSAAHGYFECTFDCSRFSKAAFLGQVGKRTPVFARFSTVAGGAGSVDTPRDVRGFAVKFYTDEGNFDLVGNNIPVFFIQDAMKFPDLVHAVKMEPDRGFPQAASAHDTFWDFVSLTPESLHMLMWAMSDRTLPRSLRHMDGFGVHTFRVVDARGRSRFVKFHWRTAQGLASTTWHETVCIAGADPDYHRRDLWESIDRGDFPRWELCLQVFDEALADSLPYDVLDPTKVVPEEVAPLQVVGHMVLNRNPDNFFAETEQVAFCPSHLVPGFDFSNDPLLQGRLFSYLDTQLSRLGGPNFHQIPVNAPRCPFHNHQRDGIAQMAVPRGRVAYEPQSLDPQGPRESQTNGFRSLPVAESGDKVRARAERFADHYSQARMFFHSLDEVEQGHVAAAFAFELGKVETAPVRDRMLGHLRVVDGGLAEDVCRRLGLNVQDIQPARPAKAPVDLDPSPALAFSSRRAESAAVRHVGVLVAAGADDTALDRIRKALTKAKARVTVIAPTLAGTRLASGDTVQADQALAAAPSCLFDAVVALAGDEGAAELGRTPAASAWMADAWRHLKPIATSDNLASWAQALGVMAEDEAVFTDARKSWASDFVDAVARGAHWPREGQPHTDG